MNSDYTSDVGILLGLLKTVKDVPGDIMEIGVYNGHKYQFFLQEAQVQNKYCHAVDSFRGMAEPTELDLHFYPKGKLSTNGSGRFRAQHGRHPLAVIHEGFIPTILDDITVQQLSFVHIDVDQYLPTKQALAWVWPRLSAGGIMVCHDFVEEHQHCCTVAIKEFRDAHRQYDGLQNTWAWWKKREGEQ